MAGLSANIGVFFGRVNNRPDGWYWTDTSTTKITGPFETKEQAVEDALQSLRTSGEMVERGVV
jgi:hypothetical protein